jgi:tRNA dimethylallyltransferase
MRPIPVIFGATGIGKSALAVKMATELNGEIISCDSRQLYKYMDIGTAKPSKGELSLVPHHLIDTIEPSEEYSAGRWAFDADDVIRDCLRRGKLPIICGGSFFYFSALRNGFDSTATPDREYRQELLVRESVEGAGTLHRELREQNPERAKKIHEHDLYRVIRALQIERDGAEVTESMDLPFSLIELRADRELLYSRINRRVDRMIELGLFEEFQSLQNRGYNEETPGLKCVGYKEFFNYIDNRDSFEESVASIKQHTRKFAKRQLTWLRNREQPQFQIDIEQLEKDTPPLLDSFRE